MPPTATDGGRDRLPSFSRGQVLKTGNRSVRVKRYYSGAAVWLQPVGAHIASCRDVDGDLSGPRAAAHRRPTLGSHRRLREHLRGGHLEGSCQGVGRVDSLRQSMRGIGVGVGPVRIRRDSSAGMARIAGTGRSAGEECGPGGQSPHWVSGSCDDPAGAPVPWLSQAMVLRRHPCRGAASLARFSFPGRER